MMIWERPLPTPEEDELQKKEYKQQLVWNKMTKKPQLISVICQIPWSRQSKPSPKNSHTILPSLKGSQERTSQTVKYNDVLT